MISYRSHTKNLVADFRAGIHVKKFMWGGAELDQAKFCSYFVPKSSLSTQLRSASHIEAPLKCYRAFAPIPFGPLTGSL